MKTTTDYMIGNTAIQIINTGRKIKVIDVEKEKKKRHFVKILFVTLIGSIFFLYSCFYIVKLHNTSTMLDRQNYILQGEIRHLEEENAVLIKETENITVDYRELYKKAKELGMKFPKKGQVYQYQAERGTTVKINDASGQVCDNGE